MFNFCSPQRTVGSVSCFCPKACHNSSPSPKFMWNYGNLWKNSMQHHPHCCKILPNHTTNPQNLLISTYTIPLFLSFPAKFFLSFPAKYFKILSHKFGILLLRIKRHWYAGLNWKISAFSLKGHISQLYVPQLTLTQSHKNLKFHLNAEPRLPRSRHL